MTASFLGILTEPNIRKMQTELFEEWDSRPQRGYDLKATIWKHSINLRPNLPLNLRRVKNYTREGSPKESYSTELECLNKVLPIAPAVNPDNAEFLLKGWLRVLSPIMDQYELTSTVMKPKGIKTPDDFIRAVVTTEAYQNLKE